MAVTIFINYILKALTKRNKCQERVKKFLGPCQKLIRV